MFGFLRDKISRVYQTLTSKLSALFSKTHIDQEWLNELKKLLLSADAGMKTTNSIINKLKERMKTEKISGEMAHAELLSFFKSVLPKQETTPEPRILLMVGVNGSGKTTFLGKLAHKLTSQNKKVLLVAGDTFRAAAPEQLKVWAEQSGATIFTGQPGQDPSSVIFDACKKFSENNFDHLLIDTAGRLQTKTNLMNELSKIKRVIAKHFPNDTIHTWLTIDSMLGQSSLSQAQIFNDSTDLSGLVMTKYDGTGKGGILFAIAEHISCPIQYITFGEKQSDLSAFKGDEFINNMLGNE